MIYRLIGRLIRVCVVLVILAGALLATLIMHALGTGKTPYRISVTGRVTDNRGNPIAGAQVRAEPLNLEYLHQSDNAPLYLDDKPKTTTADRQGRYRFRGLTGGICPILSDGWFYRQPWRIVADAEGFAPRQTEVRHLPKYRVLDRNKTFPDVDFALDEETSVSGRAVDSRGRPLAYRAIQIESEQ